MMLKSPVFWPETIRTTARLRLHGLHVWPALILLTLALATATPASAEREQARAARQKVLAEQRRVIFNDDTYELSRDDANTATGFLKRRLKPLVGTSRRAASARMSKRDFSIPAPDKLEKLMPRLC